MSGNWYSFSAPEIYLFDFCERLSESLIVPKSDRKRFESLLLALAPDRIKPATAYANPENGYYTAWIHLKPSEREAAEVFSLGKTLWCIFESCANTCNPILKDFLNDIKQEHPEYHRTPPILRELVERCTKGNLLGVDGKTEIVRRHDKVYPRGHSGWRGERCDTAKETAVAANQMWKGRVEEMGEFLETKLKWRKGIATEEDEKLIGFTWRPTLKEVLSSLIEARKTLIESRESG